ncbi:MFS transporter [Jatrophihabitans cynanchi]|uniref:MFS transporter n=1 Tax=Jatrophihabitans cynanchi TaxID=2944128 RepID=A0ABY7JZ89_9ACTN|nr:MFS transporter [Jatrophihabitans sp. SB3-54]WAX56181.1 MFS transporter [Jatrophihabitans sp. SB3-54]
MWWASAVDNVGDGAFAAAIPLLAVTMTRDPRLVSVVSAATYLPWLLLSLPVGAIVDRYDRVLLMWRSQLGQAVAVAAVAVLAGCHLVGIGSLALLAFVIGTGEVVFGNAAQAVLPEIVPAPLVHKANGAQYAITTVGQLFVGPPLGSLLFGLAVAVPFGLDAGTFAISAALLATLPRSRLPATEPSPLRAAIAEGLRWLAGHRLLRTIALVLAANNFANAMGTATLVLLATQTLHLSATGYGVLLAGGAVGSVLGGLVNARIVARVGELPALVTALAANVVLYLGLGLAPDAVVLGALLAVNGFVTTLWNIVTVSLRQRVVPGELLGRVNSVYRLLAWGLIPLGSLAGGLVAHLLGLRAPYLAAAGLRAVALAVGLPALLGAVRAASVFNRAPRGAADRPA